MRSNVLLPLLALVTVSLVGCPGETNPTLDAGGGGADTPPASFPDCEAIIEACHDVDPGSGPIHDCHETAHDAASNDACAPVREACVAMCQAIDGGISDVDGGHAHDEDAGADVDGGHAHDEDAGPDVDGGHAHDEDAGPDAGPG